MALFCLSSWEAEKKIKKLLKWNQQEMLIYLNKRQQEAHEHDWWQSSWANIVNLSSARHMFNCNLKWFWSKNPFSALSADILFVFVEAGNLLLYFRDAMEVKVCSKKYVKDNRVRFDFDELLNEKLPQGLCKLFNVGSLP